MVLAGLVPAEPAAATIPPSRCVAVTGTTDLGSSDAYGMGIDPRNGDLYVAVSGAGRMDVLDGSTHAVIDSITVPHPTLDFVVVDPDHNTLYVSSYGGDAVYAISIATEAVLATIAVTQAQGLALKTSTDRLYAASQTSTVTEINTATRTATGTLAVGGMSLGVAVDTAADRVFVGDHTNGTLDVFDRGSNAFIDSHPLPGSSPITVAFDPRTGSVWVTTRSPGHVSEIDPTTGTVGVSFSLPKAKGLALDPARRHAYVTADGAAILWAFNLLDGSQIDAFRHQDQRHRRAVPRRTRQPPVLLRHRLALTRRHHRRLPRRHVPAHQHRHPPVHGGLPAPYRHFGALSGLSEPGA